MIFVTPSYPWIPQRHALGTDQKFRLERGLVGESAGRRRGRAPRVVRGGAAAATAVGAGAAETAAGGRAALRAVHLGRGVLQGRADLFHVQLDDRALLALAGLVRALLEPAGRDDPHATGQRLGDVLGRLPPDGAAQEQ